MAGISIINGGDLNAVPIREGRQNSGTIGAINAEVVLPVNGDAAALVYVTGLSPVLTVVFEGSLDGVNYFPLQAVAGYAVGGTIPNAGQPMVLELYAAAVSQRLYQLRVAQARYVRVRASTYTSGACEVTIRSDANKPLLRNLDAITPSTLFATATGAAGAAVTCTLPAVPGMRHYLSNAVITRSAAAALTPLATPVLVTTTNLTGAPVITFGSSADAQGVDAVRSISFGDAGFAATGIGVATTFVCPGTPNVIWRVNVSYRLGV
jgi:hypothetical protein